MINLFVGDNDFLIKQKINSWKKIFVEKYWELNLIHIKNFLDFWINEILNNLTTAWFLWEKKLIIIDKLPSNSKNNSKELEEEITKILDKIPENNIVIFNSISPDKRSKFYKTLIKKADKIEEFYIKSEEDIFKLIEKKYKNKISRNWIYKIIKYKNKNFSKIILELEKLLIYYDYIDEKIIEKNIIPELEESIFILIDNILQKNIKLVLENFKIIINHSNIYQFYNWILANLRNTIYIQKLKNLNISSSEIINKLKLWNKSFLVNKKYNLNFWNLKKLYFDLIEVEKKMKTWKLLWTTEKEFIFELEKIFLKNLSK